MVAENELLFYKYDLTKVVRQQEAKMLEAIDGLDEDALLATSTDDLCDQYEAEFRINVPRLDEAGISVDRKEVRVDLARLYGRTNVVGDGPVYRQATAVTFFVPFEGDREVFSCRPSSFSPNPPRATIVGDEIVFTYTSVNPDETTLKAGLERDVTEIRRWLAWAEQDTSHFNDELRDRLRKRIEARKSKILGDRGVVASLGLPLRRRDGAPQTYVVPTVRRKATVPRQEPRSAPSVRDPGLEMAEYEHILSVITNMVAVIERSPRAFRGMREEDLRHHFLVQLNGQYEGQATGETFNYEGKTDILIRVDGKNVFLAECKYWRGPKALRRAIDQMLGYAAWRDTRTALMLFNRNKDFTSVLAEIPEVVKGHPNYKREMPYNSEMGLRYVLHHRDDVNRELILTILAFDVPA